MITRIEFYEKESLLVYRLYRRMSEIEMDEKEGICIFNHAMKLTKLAKEPILLYRKRNGRLAMSLYQLDPNEFSYKGYIEYISNNVYMITYQD